ncbi:LysE family transporter [Ferrovibrio sp.]|uniref:LysE family translocator n=1 Tax=Ferrovibrio sp. TaxID=1917215 RepID=UPI0025B89168|nr:LysE family transporter [Ferrovibrio sp.]
MLDLLVMLGKGAVAGFVIAAPVGPVGVLCVQRTLERGSLSGLVGGLGAALADAAYGCIAAFGLSLIANWLQQHELAFRLVGGVFLLFMAWRMLKAVDGSRAAALPEHEGLANIFFTTMILTATNPITIVAFLGIFAFLGIGAIGVDKTLAWPLVFGVFLGSSLWWLSLAGLAARFRDRLRGGGMLRINRGSGLLLLCFGLYGIGSVLWIWSR